MGQIMIVIGVICGALSIWLIPHGYYIRQKESQAVSEEEKLKLSPRVSIKLFLFPSQAATPYKYPLKQYELLIQNLNNNSVPIIDFRIEFIFPNIVNVVKQMPLLYSGGNLSVGGLSVYEEKKDGSTYKYEEQPMETAITKNFSLSVQKAKINETDVNTNIVIFNCERWPEKAGFSGEIVIDLSKRPEILKKPDKIGTYEGIYFYEIKGKKFSEKISGTIPNSNVIENTESIKSDWSKKLQDINPKEGTIVYNTTDQKWLERNNYFIEFIPYIKKDTFEIHAYRDSDNIFKVMLSNSLSEKCILKYEDLDKFKKAPGHPKHMVAITWGKGENKLYIDGVLVDIYPALTKK